MARHTDEGGPTRHDAIGYGGAVVGTGFLAGCIGGEESFDRREVASVVNGGEE
ncbi:hypothetical protein SAMN04488066_11667 [Halorubrum aquaticum]|uniref:Uncharacterized protein n=1 Tax=Halorubrum aquaticum TaxID=387340 RepID=A0A1I3BY53_9EURY|nr:hypothetical protein [Halorubrum aquaticum]SFH67235.1 hypothetical protein SAMN04488066_11667 [Halorubrum aquaticum]